MIEEHNLLNWILLSNPSKHGNPSFENYLLIIKTTLHPGLSPLYTTSHNQGFQKMISISLTTTPLSLDYIPWPWEIESHKVSRPFVMCVKRPKYIPVLRASTPFYIIFPYCSFWIYYQSIYRHVHTCSYNFITTHVLVHWNPLPIANK